MRAGQISIAITLCALAAGPARADIVALGIGARVGAPTAPRPEALDSLCYGLFGHVGGRSFVELALDRCPTAQEDRPTTRLSAAVGFRPLRLLVSPFVQLGVGGELAPDDALYPLAFAGVGADIALSKHLRLGVALRLEARADLSGGTGEADLSRDTMAQLFLRWDL